MRLATWNVNSLTARLPRVTEWLEQQQPDVLCMQETKQADDKFPEDVFAELGYESAHYGDGRWNGVAILSKVGLDDVTQGFGTPDDEQRTPRHQRPLRGHDGLRRLRAERAVLGQRDVPDQAGVVGPVAQDAGRALPARLVGGRVRRLQRRSRRRGRLGPGRLRRRDARERARARAPWPGSRNGGSTTSSGGSTSRARSPGGTTGPGTSTRAGGCASTWSWSVTTWCSGRPGRFATAMPARGRSRPTTRPWSSTSR